MLASGYPPDRENLYQAVGGIRCPLTQMIYVPSCSLPWHLSFSHSLQQGLVPSRDQVQPKTSS